MMGKKRKDEIKNCTFRIMEGPVTVPFKLRKVQSLGQEEKNKFEANWTFFTLKKQVFVKYNECV